MKHILNEWHTEQSLHWVRVDIAEQLQRVRVGGTSTQNRPRLQHELICAEVIALQEDELILVTEVQRPVRVFHDAEVERFQTRCRCVRPVVARDEQLCSPKPGLHIISAWGEDGIVTKYALVYFHMLLPKSHPHLIVTSTGVVSTSNCSRISM